MRPRAGGCALGLSHGLEEPGERTDLCDRRPRRARGSGVVVDNFTKATVQGCLGRGLSLPAERQAAREGRHQVKARAERGVDRGRRFEALRCRV